LGIQVSEFTVETSNQYRHDSPVMWILSHIWHHRLIALVCFLTTIVSYGFFSYAQVLIGEAAGSIIDPAAANLLPSIALSVLFVMVASGIFDLIRSLTLETLAQRLEMSSREEMYTSLLGKSQTFHDRQRVGNLMAMATDDVLQLNMMINPGILFIMDIILGFAIPTLYIALISLELALVPLLFIAGYIVMVRAYAQQLNPIAYRQRERFSKMNAAAEETISGIEVVKASAQETRERRRFRRNALLFRGLFIKQGFIEARYLPLLAFGLAFGLGFLHAAWMVSQGRLEIAQMIAFVGLFNLLRFPTFIAIFCFTLVQLGIAGARRILNIINAETELDQNLTGHSAELRGEVVFENVSFGYEVDSEAGQVQYDEGGAILKNISFQVEPGQTVAVVGQTGSGKSTLTELINRTYDATEGRVLIDGVDVRDWNLTSLRSQISRIEQDVFLFSRTLAENIAFGKPNATQEEIEMAARSAQAHDFIMSFKDGYQTVVGERGVTLSGGQRQRIALARAFLSDPRILILDDSTSAIDSATEDEIQKAIRKMQEGRTTFLITHRLSQIRWADTILVLERGELVACGSHDFLLRTSPHYRRIFARYDIELPPLESETAQPVLVEGK
jgi:ATP-binding cassette subfamily B protein